MILLPVKSYFFNFPRRPMMVKFKDCNKTTASYGPGLLSNFLDWNCIGVFVFLENV